ncbi:sec1 family domain-containing protein 2-like [Mya arenaria]|uniref:sec1 family domain-containing protein 2-like n=1 Tax=Mya arenaria TaxID=6604 RepID=UPI0022E9471D|nr:sec1 family domain-containing protein 2-like [Mya arenaria]
MKSVAAGISRQWEKVFSHVNRAVVFLDQGVGELLHWQGGLTRLLKAGASDVKEFSSFESGAESDKKAVFIVSGLLEGDNREIICDILQASNFQYVVVVVCQGSASHAFSMDGHTDEDPEFFNQVEERVLEWMGNMNYTAEVFHIPLSTISIGNSVFLLPGYSRLSPLMESDVRQIELQYNNSHSKAEHKDIDSLKSVDFSVLPKHLQVQFKCFVSSVDGLLAELGVREDIYAMGHTSALLASELESFPTARNRRKTKTERASILFVDRSLDLAAVTSHTSESLMDRIQMMLPRLPGHVTDVKVNMAPLCHVDRETGSSVIAPGCLATQTGSEGHLQAMMTGKQKEALMEVNRQLVEAAAQCDLPLSLSGKPGRVTAEQLDSTLKLFRGKYKQIMNHLDWIQVSMATSEMLSHPDNRHIDERISVEKGLLQSLDDPSGLEALSQVQQMLAKKHEDRWIYSIDDVLCMLVYLYSLVGPPILEHEETEEEIQKSILDRVLAEKGSLPSIIKSIVTVGGKVGDRLIVSELLDGVWEKLAAVAQARANMREFREILEPGSAVSPVSLNPLIRQLVSAILDPGKPDLPDVENKSSGLKDMLKSGFGLFRAVSKPRPSDHPLLILIFIGGVTCTEVKQVKDLVNQLKPGIQVVIGSTRLLTPQEAVMTVLGADSALSDSIE